MQTMMQAKQVLTMDGLMKIATAAKANTQGWKVSIAIVDDGGNPLWLKRLEGATPISAYVAQAKAHSAALGRRETKGYEDMINKGRFAFLSAPKLDGMLEGDVPIMFNGQCLGAVGVSGVQAVEDAQVAFAGVAAIAGNIPT